MKKSKHTLFLVLKSSPLLFLDSVGVCSWRVTHPPTCKKKHTHNMTTTKHGNFVMSKCTIKVTVKKPASDGVSS